MINWRDHITTNPGIQNGKPAIKNTRITVELILEKLAEGENFNQIMESHPRVTEKSIYTCLAFASDSSKNF